MFESFENGMRGQEGKVGASHSILEMYFNFFLLRPKNGFCFIERFLIFSILNFNLN